ncbi:hypothetical protein Angca_002821 [Angiostrongylus cantonensis]|nr:hypothetical protein Angca_002821 [Angiostrongylus cantonensis]
METKRKAMLARAPLNRLHGNAQHDLSRSLHSLEFIHATSGGLPSFFTAHRTEAATVRRRKSEVELGTDDALDSRRLAADEQGRTPSEPDRPVQRRRRFTRKQRKSVTIDPETSLILATRRYSSSSEDDDQGSAIRSKPAERLNNARGLSVSVNILTPKEIVKTPRGPAARRAGRRSALLKSRAVAASTTNLDQLKTVASNLEWEGRSMSVRDLNGEEFDFSNKDSVTRWTSQILAELDSLPSSCIDLTQHEKIDSFSVFSQKTDWKNPNSSLKNGGLKFSPLKGRAGIKPPPVPPHRQSMCEPKTIVDRPCANDKLMTSSVIEPMTSTFGSIQSNSRKTKSPVRMGVDVTSSVDSVDSWISSFETFMSSSFHDPISGGSIYSTTSNQSRGIKKDSEDSSATFVVSLSDSNGDETPQAFTPLPTEEFPPPASSDRSTASAEAMSFFVAQCPKEACHEQLRPEMQSKLLEKPIPAPRTTIDERTHARCSMSPLTPNCTRPGAPAKVAFRGSPSVAPEENVRVPTPELRQKSPSVAVRQHSSWGHSPHKNSDTRLTSTYARFDDSLCRELKNVKPLIKPRNRLSIPMVPIDRWAAVQRSDQTYHNSNELDRWKKRAQCRLREHQEEPPSTSEPRSVNGVVASLIRSIEANRYTVLDTPAHVRLDCSGGQDATTQTSPFSISRSSSFDWINEPAEVGLRDLATPLGTPRSELPAQLSAVSKQAESSSETDDADREVAEMTQNVDRSDRTHSGATVIENENHKLFTEMEESIAMLLEYGQHQPQKAPLRRNLSCQKSNDSNSLTSSMSSTTKKPDLDSLPSDLSRSRGGSSLTMTESIYDNMPRERRRRRSQEAVTASPMAQPWVDPACSMSQISADSGPARLTSEQSRRSIRSIGSVNVIPDDQFVNSSTQAQPPFSIANRAGSCEMLTACQNENDSFNLEAKLKNAEEDALECCRWLKQAGFPQYAKQYQEGGFPIDIRSVRSDHEFLGPDSLRALYRRLNILNRCAIMRIDQVVLRRRNNDYAYGMCDGFDDDDSIALSGNWRYQRHSHTWSRVGNEQMYGVPGRTVCPKPNWDSYRNQLEPRRYEVRTGYGTHSNRPVDGYDTRADCNGNSAHNKLQRSHSERIKERARAIMKKIDLRSSSRRRKEARHHDPTTMVIGDPVLVSYDSASPETMRMIPRPSNLDARSHVSAASAISAITDHRVRSRSARRQGLVILSPSSPDSSDDCFLSFGYRRPLGTSTSMRRDRSVPPQLVDRANDNTSHERLRRERTPRETYLYIASPGSMSRTSASAQSSLPHRRTVHQSGYDGGGISPYYDVSPDASLSRLHLPRSESPSISSGVPQLCVDTHANKSESSLDNTDEEQSSVTTTMNHNRRDSGVGSSLSRSPSGPSSQRLRQSILPYSINPFSFFLNTNHVGSLQSRRRAADRNLMSSSIMSSCSSDDAFFTDAQLAKCIDSLSVLELARLNKLSYLRVTAVLEKYMTGSDSTVKIGDFSPVQNGVVKNWRVQKLFRKIKQMDGKTGRDIEVASVFGQPLAAIYKRLGLCLPRTILEILRFLRQMAPDTVGIFRKNGVKSRILELRTICDRDSDVDVFVEEYRLDQGQVHDVADVLKQYLRELPEPLMTARLSETFANIFIHVPENERLATLQYAILLLPDENREALQTLLLFLYDVSKHADSNNMPAQNLAVCFTPSLFHLSASRLDKVTPTRRHKTIGAAGMPSEQEMRETRAAQQCLTYLIQHCRTVFICEEIGSEERSHTSNGAPLLKELGLKGPRSYLIDKVLELVKEHSEQWKAWIFDGVHDDVEISHKIPNDCHPLKLYRAWVDVAAPPKQVMSRIMRERNVWDTSVVNWRTIDVLHAPDTDLHQYVLNDTVGHPTRDCFVARFHRSDLSEIRGACAITERSVQCSEAQLLGGISAEVLDCRFLIEPKAGHSRVTYISRVDLRGRGPTWYNKVYGCIIARQMIRLRDSFQSGSENVGPETKV